MVKSVILENGKISDPETTRTGTLETFLKTHINLTPITGFVVQR
jgi:hypothetical protein